MCDTSSDSESSCGWTFVSNEGSDIETLGPEAAVEFGVDLLERPLLDQTPTATPAAHAQQLHASQDAPLPEPDEPRGSSETGAAETDPAAATCFSDHSDIVTLGELKEREDADAAAATTAAAAASEEFYMGRSCSSQYAFSATETVFAAAHSSSSEDEAAHTPSAAAVRRRRLRRNTANSAAADPQQHDDEEEEEEEEERADTEPSEEEDEEQEAAREERKPPPLPTSDAKAAAKPSGGSILNRCIILALVVAISMAYGHFHGTLQTQERQKMVDKVRVGELEGKKDLLHVRKLLQREVVAGSGLQSWLQQLKSEVKQAAVRNQRLKSKLKREEQLLLVKWEELRELRRRSDGGEEERPLEREELWEELRNLRSDVAEQENQSLSGRPDEERLREESQRRSLAALLEELRNLRSHLQRLEAAGDSLRTEKRGLSEQLEAERQLALAARRRTEAALGEARELRGRLEAAEAAGAELRREAAGLRSRLDAHASEDGGLRARLAELEQRLAFEQQRSDLWERLYVESKEDRAKGDTQPKAKKPKDDLVGKVKETFDAIKNSTKEFVHHHKEQMKKVKEAVKENLRKFSDSVKSLPNFYQWKDSAASLMDKARGFYKKPEEQAARPGRGHPSGFGETFQSGHNTRKPGHGVRHERGVDPDACGGGSRPECAWDRPMEPIRADEFHQLLQSYLQQQVDHFHHWDELEAFVNGFFFNGLFVHERTHFADFISGVEGYLADMHEYHGLDEHVFGDLDDYIYRHYFGEGYAKGYGPREGDAAERDGAQPVCALASRPPPLLLA